MRAYKIQSEPPYPEYSFGMTTVSLPMVRCDVCRRTWGEIGVYHPTAGLSKPLSSKLKKLSEPLSVPEFSAIQRMLPKMDPKLWDFPPGCALGVQKMSVDKPPGDFLFDSTCSIISNRALGVLKKAKVEIHAAPVDLFCCRKSLEGWLAVDFPSVRLLDDESKEKLGIVECSCCKEIRITKSQDPRKLVLGHSDYNLIQGQWPKNLGLGVIRETGTWIASPQFIKTWEAAGLTGLRFVPVGNWVKG
jgi:hypothetical protein